MTKFLGFDRSPTEICAPDYQGQKLITPALLYFNNDEKLIEDVCNFKEKSSGKRQLRSQELRGKNISRFSREYEVGDLVRFNMKGPPEYIGFGRVISKKGSKIYTIVRIDSQGTHEIHAQQLEKVVVSEYFLKKMLGLS